MMLDKKQIWAIFLFRFKMGCKAAETTHNINNASDPGTANECTVQGWFKKFCKGDKSLEDEECSGWPSEVDNNNWEPSFKADPFTNTWEVAKELSLDHSMVIRHLKQIEKVRKLGKWVPHEMTENQKDHHLKCHLVLFYIRTTNHFLIGLWHITKSGFFMTTGDNQLSGWTKTMLQSTSQSQTCTKKRSQSLFGGLLHVWFTTAFWMLVNPLHLRSVLANQWSTPKNHNAYSQHWSTERAPFFSMTTPNYTKLQKLNDLGYDILPHLPYSPDLLPTNYHFLQAFWKLFAEKMLPQPDGGRKCFPRVHQVLKHGFLCYRNK